MVHQWRWNPSKLPLVARKILRLLKKQRLVGLMVSPSLTTTLRATTTKPGAIKMALEAMMITAWEATIMTLVTIPRNWDETRRAAQVATMMDWERTMMT